ncbi:MAG: cyclohexanone monooxygenase [Porticoccaceae bacterium]|jgi:acetone monooxygenase|nr:cyclohexanone monooxygenase [Porticoccaceae bacterium]
MPETALQRSSETTQFDAIVVGAGIAGLYQLYRLRELGLRVCALDAAADVGGTWYWNCYPGARVDSQSHVYQYWFSDELLREWDWQERFPAQPETERYLNFVADKFGLRKDIRFNTRIASARWDEDARIWTLNSEAGESFTARYFVSCAGMLSAPLVPPFPGHERFRGTIAHTARWPREGLDLTGKRVGVVGTGATGIQVIQTIAGEVAELKVFQRTPQYAVAMHNEHYDDAKRAELRAHYPEYREQVQHTFAGFAFDFAYEPGEYYRMTPQARREALEKLWQDGSLAFWIGSFPELVVDEAVSEEVSEFVREKIRARIQDPVVAEKLVPYSYGFGTYRVPLEKGYYDVFNRDNVELVDVRETPIEGFTEQGLVVGGREYPLDVVVLATGFDAGTGALSRMDVHGRGGRSLTELWNRDIRSTLGLQVHGFPNLFTVAGPLAPSTAFCNMTTCLQQQVDWVTDCISWLRQNDHQVIEPSAEKEEEWVKHHDEVAAATLMMRTTSWYTGANIEGKPRRLLSYIGGAGNYHKICDQVKDSGYAGFEIA